MFGGSISQTPKSPNPGIFPDLNPDLAGIPDFGKSGVPIWPESRIREIGNPDFAGIGKINPDARASGISGSGISSGCLVALMVLDFGRVINLT
jgi:hypothetical protein